MAFCIVCLRRQAEELSTEDGKKVENGWQPKRHPFYSRKDLLERIYHQD